MQTKLSESLEKYKEALGKCYYIIQTRPLSYWAALWSISILIGVCVLASTSYLTERILPQFPQYDAFTRLYLVVAIFLMPMFVGNMAMIASQVLFIIMLLKCWGRLREKIGF